MVTNASGSCRFQLNLIKGQIFELTAFDMIIAIFLPNY